MRACGGIALQRLCDNFPNGRKRAKFTHQKTLGKNKNASTGICVRRDFSEIDYHTVCPELCLGGSFGAELTDEHVILLKVALPSRPASGSHPTFPPNAALESRATAGALIHLLIGWRGL